MCDTHRLNNRSLLHNIVSFIGLFYIRDRATPHVWHEMFIGVTWLIRTCDSFIGVTWLIRTCDSFIGVTWLIGVWLSRTCDKTHSYVRTTQSYVRHKIPFFFIQKINAPYFCKTYVNESRRTCEQAISLKLSHASLKLRKVESRCLFLDSKDACAVILFLTHTQYTHINESCRTYEQVTSHMDESCDTYQHFAHTQHGVKNDAWSAKHMNGSRHTWTSPVAHTWVSHVTHGWVMSHMNVSCHTYRDLAPTQHGCNDDA